MPGRDDDRWTIAAIGVIAVLACSDLALGANVQFIGSLVIAPFLAGAMVSPRPTLIVALLALATALFLSPFNELSTMESTARLFILVGGCGLAVWLSAQRVRREREYAAMSRVAEVAQRCVLTSVPAQVGGLAFASRYISASPVALIGGDFYEVLDRDGGGVRAVVGDVRGKGLEAVRLAAVVLGSFREAAQSLDCLEDVAVLVDRRLRRHLEAEDFVTAVFAEFREDGGLRIVNCGHHPPVLVRPGDAPIELLTPPSATTPLGLDPSPVAEEAVLLPGDRLLLYTDGLVEARSQSGRTIALDHLAGTLRHPNLDGALAELVNELQSLVIGDLEDDLALLLVEYRGPGMVHEPEETRILSITPE
ncbi:MAG: serine/threonine-protein phosphatase [Actinomycetota bacterium]|nr:serine/threonine-protein phosphatase [Actinomycetota bacterium]